MILTALTITAIVIALIRNTARPDFIFLTGLIVLLITGVLTPQQAFAGFANTAVFTVAALFIIAAAVRRTRALRFLDRSIFRDHLGIRSVIFRMMASAGFFSAFLNNTPIVAMLIPQVQEWAKRTGISSSRLLIPLSYAAVTGGIITLIGTSTNLIVSGMMVDRGFEPLGFFDLTAIGLPASILVLLYFSTIGYKTLPGHLREQGSGRGVETGQGQGSGQGMQQGVRVDADASWQEGSSGQKGDIGQGVRVDGRRVQQDTQPEYQFDLKIPKGSPLHQQSVDEAGLRALDKLFLIHIHRHNRIILPVTPETELLEGDILTFTGDLESVDALAERKNLERAVPVLDQNADHLPVFEAVVAPTSSLIGRTLKESLFRERFNAVVIGIQRQSDTLRGALGQIPIRPGDLLLIEGRKSFAQQWQRGNNEFYLVSERGDRMYPMTAQAPWVLTLIGAMLASVITGLLPMVTAALTTALVLVLIGVVRKRDIFGAVELPILLVIAASIGIGNAMESSGLATALAATVTGITTPLGLTATVIGIYLLTNLLTELITNNAAAVLMLPIALAAGLQTGLDPHTVAIIVAVAASASFLTPIGYQTNLMVMGAGRYKYTDYTKAGLPVTLILLGVTLAVVVLGG